MATNTRRFQTSTPASYIEPPRMTWHRIFYVGDDSAAKDFAGDDQGNGDLDESSTYGLDPFRPFSSIEHAYEKVVDGRGDEIHILPGTARSITGAAATVNAGLTLDKSCKFVGLGDRANRPAITFDTATAAQILVSGNGVEFENLDFIVGIDAVAVAIAVTGTHFGMRNCQHITADASYQATLYMTLSAAADYATIENCSFQGTANAGLTSQVQLTGTDRTTIKDCDFTGDCSAANVEVKTTACTNLLITRNHIENYNAVDVGIEMVASSTGWLSHNNIRVATDGQATFINTGSNASLFENYGVNNNGETGMLEGTTSS